MTAIVPPPAPPGDHAPTGPPVLVAGAGPVGLCAALSLARFGVPSVVLEGAPKRDDAYFTTTGSKAICFQRDVLDVFDRLGVADPLVAEGTTWTTARTYFREHEVRTVTFPADAPSTAAPQLPPWINISQARVEQELLRRAQAEPLVGVRFGHRVRGVRQDAGGVTVAVDCAGGRRVVRGSHLIGADGPHSTVRALLGVDFPGQSFRDRFLICDIRAELPFPNERRFYFDPEWNPGRQVLVHQCPDSTWRIDWQVPDGYDLDAERASGALDTRIRRIVGPEPYEVVWSSVYRFHERCADRFRLGRVFLAGDAAHVYAPFGARGLNSGVQDVENLGWKLAAARAAGGDARAGRTLLDSYHLERWAAAQENLRVTGETMRFLVPHTGAERDRRRETLERAVTEPDASSLIDSGKLAEPYWYPESPLTTPPAEAEPIDVEPGAARPPVPGVICPDGACRPAGGGHRVRLRQLIGPGFLVVSGGARHVPELAEATAACPLPVAVYALSDIEGGGALAEALRAGPDTAHVVRPDAHLCAVLPATDTEAVRAAIHRACGQLTAVREATP